MRSLRKSWIGLVLVFFFGIILFFWKQSSYISNIFNSDNIIAKVGNQIITSLDVENEIMTILITNKTKISQDSINKTKNIAMKELIRKLIKKNEIKKFSVKNYSKKDLNQYLLQVAKRLGTNRNGLKKIFKQNIKFCFFMHMFFYRF